MNGVWARVRPHAPAVLAALSMRARFFFTPISTDEGGYLAIGRAWLRGASLYKDHVIDRPQGLLLLYGLWDRIGLGSIFGVRLLALLACVAAAVACGVVAAAFAGARARVLASLSVAVLASVPQYEGFIANAELLSCAFGAAALALVVKAVWNQTGNADWRLLVAAGASAGTALTMKQSGFDAIVAVCVVLLIAWWRARSMRPIMWFVLGVGSVGSLVVLHASLTGFHRWWYAIVGYKLHERSAISNAKWEMLRTTARIALPALLGAVMAAKVAGFSALRVGRARRVTVVLVVWAVAALAAVAAGGNFHRHYWVIVTVPLGTTVGVMVSLVNRRLVRALLMVAALLVPAVMSAQAATFGDRRVAYEIHGDKRVWENVVVEKWLRPRLRTGDVVYAMCASAGLYGAMRLEPPLGHLWYDAVVHMPGVRNKLLRLLDGADRPRFVVMFQSAGVCDPSGKVGRTLRAGYYKVDEVAATPILERVDNG